MWDEAQPASSSTALAAATRSTRVAIMAASRTNGSESSSHADEPGVTGTPAAGRASAHAAVDADHLAADVGGGIRAQEAHDGGHLVGRTGATGGHHLLHHLRREGLFGHAPGDHARC